jgi:hypothetical protein
MVKSRKTENLLDVRTQYEILEFTDCLHSWRDTSFVLVRFDEANQQIGYRRQVSLAVSG